MPPPDGLADEPEPEPPEEDSEGAGRGEVHMAQALCDGWLSNVHTAETEGQKKDVSERARMHERGNERGNTQRADVEK